MDYEENYTLQIEASFNPQHQLGKVISHLFSNDYIFTHPYFRKCIQEDRKGYIGIEQLLKNQSIQKYFEDINILKQEHQLIFLKSTIQLYCPELHYHHHRVRRIDPWKRNIIKQIRPFSISKLKPNLSISDVRQQLENYCFTTNKSLRPNQEFIFLYSQNFIGKPSSKDNPFQIVTYAEICKQKARRSKAWISQEHRNYRPLEFHPHSAHRYHQHQQLNIQTAQQVYIHLSEPNSQQREDFTNIVKRANTSLNDMLSSYIDMCQSEYKESQG